LFLADIFVQMKKKKLFFLVLILSCFSFKTLTAGDNTGKLLRESISVEEYNRTYALYRPTGWDKQKNMPLVLLLHGAGGNADDMERLTGFIDIAEREKFILVYPEGINNQWNDGRGRNELVNDVGFISKLVDFMANEFSIDKNKVYVGGMSNGGFMTMRLACELADKITAVAAVAATVDSAVDANCQTAKPVPVMLIIGNKDKLVPLNGGIVPRLPKSVLLSHRALTAKWARRDGCNMQPNISDLPELNHDGTTVTKTVYSGGKNNTEVISYLVGNGGHTWPGGSQYLPAMLIGKTTHELIASEVIWEFFKRH
jgi:polyhydroxybutyrate depolymerase